MWWSWRRKKAGKKQCMGSVHFLTGSAPWPLITPSICALRAQTVQEKCLSYRPAHNKNSLPTAVHKRKHTQSTLSLSLSGFKLPKKKKKPMKSSRQFSNFGYSSPTTVTFTFHNDSPPPPPPQESREIPIETPSVAVPITVHLPQERDSAAAKIQSAYRARVIRSHYKQISTVNSEANRLKLIIQRQETVDSIRSDEREKLRMNETLMRLLLKLDSVPGIDPAVREARRKVSRMIVGLQEIVDGISEAKVEEDYYEGWGVPRGICSMRDWDEVVEEMEKQLCRERGGPEMERFCADYLGFRCLQRFLRE